MADDVSKSWFNVMANPQEHGYPGTPQEIVDNMADDWMNGSPTRSCALAYCVSADGLHHVHAVLEDVKAMRFSAVKKVFPSMHIEPTKGSKEQAEDYINKRGRFQEKGEQVLAMARRGEIKGAQGSRRDLDIIEELINQGKTPVEIMSLSFAYRRYEKMIRGAFYDKRYSETPYMRENICTWHIGESGSGKTYVSKKIVDERGEDALYLLSDYSGGGLDLYCGQPVLFLDEFRGQVPFYTLLQWLDVYRQQFRARYANGYMLWTEVHISSVIPPEIVYNKMVQENTEIDTYAQLRRRINFIEYHWKDAAGYHSYKILMSEYKGYEDLKNRALGRYDFQPVQGELVFD